MTPAAALARQDWRPLPALDRWPAAPAAVWFRYQVRYAAEDGAAVAVREMKVEGKKS